MAYEEDRVSGTSRTTPPYTTPASSQNVVNTRSGSGGIWGAVALVVILGLLALWYFGALGGESVEPTTTSIENNVGTEPAATAPAATAPATTDAPAPATTETADPVVPDATTTPAPAPEGGTTTAPATPPANP